jgi:hypothetical protein
VCKDGIYRIDTKEIVHSLLTFVYYSSIIGYIQLQGELWQYVMSVVALMTTI